MKIEIDTPHGPALARLFEASEPAGALVLGHGAAGGFGAKDLEAATGAAVEAGVTVAQLEQPYLGAGRRSPAPAKQLDTAWTAAVERLRGEALGGLTLVTGGRSAGARVACRTAAETAAVAVLCLAFPVHPPGRPEKTRLDELDGVEVPVLVVQGDSDPFGMPPPARGREVVTVPGNHSLKGDLQALAGAVQDWLPGVLR
jgi:predicted alpha/beta-hydrolase family hydrolase